MLKLLSDIVTIKKIKKETPSVTTLIFDKQYAAHPGQFVMVWIPGVDEIPMALSAPDAISVQAIGVASSALSNMKVGEKIGIRGPFGNGFSLGKKVLCIGGGVGLAPLRMIASACDDAVYLIGGRNKAELLYLNELATPRGEREDPTNGGLNSSCTISPQGDGRRKHKAVTVQAATDDGSYGHHGFVTELIALADPNSFDTICVCGPEMMMKNAYLALEACNISSRVQFSMHRYMKCGAGVCGSCCMDPHGYRVCADGPVFYGSDLGTEEFGLYHRDAAGRRVKG
jgi:dihydroorotate dehydrogenase electron transfer subunit